MINDANIKIININYGLYPSTSGKEKRNERLPELLRSPSLKANPPDPKSKGSWVCTLDNKRIDHPGDSPWSQLEETSPLDQKGTTPGSNGHRLVSSKRLLRGGVGLEPARARCGQVDRFQKWNIHISRKDESNEEQSYAEPFSPWRWVLNIRRRMICV